VQGRQFPVTVLYTKTPESNYVDATVTTILQIHLDQPTGDILAFLTGREEIENVAKLLQQKIKLFPPEAKTLLICPLYAAQSNDQQRKAFEQTPSGCRKVIIATNIAETSLTVPNIKYVVDCGLVKMKTRAAKPSDGLRKSLMVNILSVTPISHEQAWQRAGRAGRTQPGVCYRLYQETAFAKLDKSQVPEIRRIDLTTLVLQLMVIGIKDVINFPYLEAPDKTAVGGALAHLFKLGAIDRHRNVTELGRQMALFPVDPALAKVLITSKANRCSDQILSIIAMLNVENIFHLSNYKGAGTSEMNSANSGPNGSTGSAIGSRKTGQDEDTNARSSGTRLVPVLLCLLRAVFFNGWLK
jgi:HrpA-like RNA helicase